MSIGDVLAHLRGEFPDTTISKLRFLEAEGLVEPRRTASGYRKYSWDDVARLRFVLTAQRDQYLPLRVIRDQLAAMEGDPGPVLSPVGAPGEPEQVRLSRADLLARTGLAEADLAGLIDAGLLVAHGGHFDADALEIATAVAELGAYGLQTRHLRAWRTAADREIGLFEQVVTPLARQRGPEARARAAEAVTELLTLSRRLHTALVRAGMRAVLGR